jgi:hypothetical protein
MSNALFAFDDRAAGQHAADRLVEQGVPPAAVQVHAHRPYEESFPRQADEQITGGLITNLADLFQGLFEWDASPHVASSFEETVRRGGVVVSVDVDSDDERKRADEVMLAAGCSRHTGWSDAPATRAP